MAGKSGPSVSHIRTEELPVKTIGWAGGGVAASSAAKRAMSLAHSGDDTGSTATGAGGVLAQPASARPAASSSEETIWGRRGNPGRMAVLRPGHPQ